MNNRTVLLVDDDACILRANERVFRAAGWKTLKASSAAEAITLLPKADVVLSDFNMVGGNGDEVANAAGDTPVVFYSGMPQQVKHPHVITKPATHQVLLDTVDRVLQAHKGS